MQSFEERRSQSDTLLKLTQLCCRHSRTARNSVKDSQTRRLALVLFLTHVFPFVKYACPYREDRVMISNFSELRNAPFLSQSLTRRTPFLIR